MPDEPGRLPRDMAALVLGAFGGPDALERRTVPRPEPKGREVLIRVAYCGVCRHDLLTRAGAFPGIGLPVIPGHQVSGTVVARGPEATAHAVGDRVMTLIYTGCGDCVECRAGNAALRRVERPRFLGEDMDGGYAEYVAVREDTVVAVPGAVPLVDASILTCTYGTAYHAIVTRGALQAGETVVVTGASGGVGPHARRHLLGRQGAGAGGGRGGGDRRSGPPLRPGGQGEDRRPGRRRGTGDRRRADPAREHPRRAQRRARGAGR